MPKCAATQVGGKVRAARHDKGMTVEQLAAASGVGMRALINIEHGRTMPRIDTAERIATALEMSLSDLVAVAA
ncbi:unnamed protein product [Phaeothamnion confervicola]